VGERYFSARNLSLGLVAAAMLAGCGGSQGLSPAAPQASAQGAHSITISPDARACHHGGVRVSPCSVDFSVSNPGPDTVTVRTPLDKKGTLSEADTCGGASGIATVTQGTSDDWIVTAGEATGSCAATFTYTSKRGKGIGHAVLSITNSI
jgi:hypothetical protein